MHSLFSRVSLCGLEFAYYVNNNSERGLIEMSETRNDVPLPSVNG